MGPSRWLIVVRRDKPEVYTSLRRSFALDERIEVILDDRGGERRVPAGRVPDERRRGERRRPVPPAESAFAEHAGFFVVVRDEGALPGGVRVGAVRRG